MAVVLQGRRSAAKMGSVQSKHTPESIVFENAGEYGAGTHRPSSHAPQQPGLLQDPRSTERSTAIILGYFDGQSYIADQLQSLLHQTHSAIHIYICDDKSEHPFSLDSFSLDQDKLAKISIGVRLNNIGYTNNFLDALANVPDDFEFFAFSDQDDIWHDDKLERAIAALDAFPPKEPALYCARTEIADETCDQILGHSPLFNKPPSFANALVQNIGGGNTMVFNKAAKDLILKFTQGVTVVSHDWWCYQVVSGAGGNVFYDPDPCLKYRQHGRNLVGKNTGWQSRLLRIRGFPSSTME